MNRLWGPKISLLKLSIFLLWNYNSIFSVLFNNTLNFIINRGYIMSIVLAPIAEGKVDKWRQWANDLQNGRAKEFEAFNSRYGLTRHSAWLVETPNGPVVTALHEGPGADKFMPALSASDNEFDVWFKQNLSECHNIDFNQPPPGSPPELVINSVK
jgi:hypothetical protein